MQTYKVYQVINKHAVLIDTVKAQSEEGAIYAVSTPVKYYATQLTTNFYQTPAGILFAVKA